MTRDHAGIPIPPQQKTEQELKSASIRNTYIITGIPIPPQQKTEQELKIASIRNTYIII